MVGQAIASDGHQRGNGRAGRKLVKHRFTFALSDEAMAAFEQWMQDENFTRYNEAARFLLEASLSQWPRLAIKKAYLATMMREIRMEYVSRIVNEMQRITTEVSEELQEGEMDIMREEGVLVEDPT